MTDQNAQANALEEAERGNEALTEARVLWENALYSGAVSRAYYAAFHWARALLVMQGIEAKTHRGVIQLISLHFVKTNRLSRESVSLLGQLETNRELSDYRPAAKFSREDAQQAIADAESFLAECRALVPFLKDV
ncbi:MAG: HEPN domain-containing protein [Lentisphaerae bacterium]|mgnify:FL=1|nr:HEPN domain-containing protein [Lentisphaerota bacterium]MBT4816842.1 HEPN domain-containing protein [Lentisphaerota bacterium]MBT5611098.1 HEPN domain-containing protein [Lentisphaerota bacterium]MBT7055640.1 HEPN domain-containing protein [Lentisphaerota bacterium]MBT7846587.1 HEPN domain-containing protein [Lentisphaerota bacterium]